jgi:hypothetical protein
MVTNFEFLFVRWIANLTEVHLPAGNRVANANLLIRGSLVIPIFVKNPRFNISKNCEKNVSKSEQSTAKTSKELLDPGWNTCALSGVNL